MRPIKFRAWNNYIDEMIHWDELQDDHYGKLDCFSDPVLEFMQYAGLKDKYGREIYEGDIGWDEWNECYGVVKFNEGGFVYEWDNICEDLYEVHDSIEITGNYYDNPELSEVQA